MRIVMEESKVQSKSRLNELLGMLKKWVNYIRSGDRATRRFNTNRCIDIAKLLFDEGYLDSTELELLHQDIYNLSKYDTLKSFKSNTLQNLPHFKIK